MDRIVDLDAAAAEIERRRTAWLADGLTPGRTTWRDTADSWPHALQFDRDKVRDPDSLGVRVTAGDDAEMEITLFRGGWADLIVFAARHPDEVIDDAPEIATPEAFGALLDSAIAGWAAGPIEARAPGVIAPFGRRGRLAADLAD